MKKIILMVILLLSITLCSCSYEDKDSSSTTAPGFTVILPNESVPETTTTTVVDISEAINTAKQVMARCPAPVITTTIVSKKPEETTTTTTKQITFSNISKKVYIKIQCSTFYSSFSTSSPIMRYINKNEEVEAKAISSDNVWYKITYKNWTGYIQIKDTTEEKPKITTTIITTKPVSTTTQQVVQNTGYRLPYVLSENDWIDICKVVSSETGYCGEKQQKAVANTIFNRIIWANQYGHLNPYPKDVYSILRQKNQYNAIYHWSKRASKDSRLGYGGSLWNQTMKYIKEAAYEADFTNGAIGYYNPSPKMGGYLSAFENNRALLLSYEDKTGRFFRLNPACYTRK